MLERLSVPVPPLYFTLGTKTGNIFHTKLRVGMSDLNAHLFPSKKLSHQTVSACNNTPETTNHFNLGTCHIHAHYRAELFRNMTTILQSDFSSLPPDIKTDILLHEKKT